MTEKCWSQEGADVLSPEDPAEQVAAVVRAEAHAGVPEPQQASAAAQAVTVAARKAKKAKLAEQEDSVLSRIAARQTWKMEKKGMIFLK